LRHAAPLRKTRPPAAPLACALCAAALLALFATVARAEPGELRLRGTNTFRCEYYQYDGDPAASSYAEEDGHRYDELQLALDQRFSPSNFWHAEMFGLWNNSAYRSTHDDVVVERLALSWENGSAAMPFRLELGDVFADVSYRTMSRTLKGVQLDLQPSGQVLDGRQSLLLFGGVDYPEWRDLDSEESRAGGASWLLEGSRIGSLSLNWVCSDRESLADALPTRNRQNVLSLASERGFEALGQKLTLEGELAGFFGDCDASGGDDGRNKSDLGVFLQLSGRSASPLRYRFRFEQYGEDYRPAGANVASDRRSWEAHGSWRFRNGASFKARAQRFEDGFEADNPSDSKVYGVSLTGPFLSFVDPALSGGLDLHRRMTRDENDTTDRRTDVVRANLSRRLAEKWTGNLGLYSQRDKDKAADQGPSWNNEVRVGATRQLTLLGGRGSISPGLSHRRNQGDADAREWNPTLGLHFTRGRHRLSLNAAANSQQRIDDNTIDVNTCTMAANYNYTRGPHTLGVEVDRSAYDPDDDDSTASLKCAVWYSLRFGARYSPAQRRFTLGTGAAAPAATASAAPGQPELRLLTELRPGQDLAAARQWLSRTYGIEGGVRMPQFDVFEVRLLPEFDQRQRLVLQHDGQRLEKVGLIVEIEDVGTPDTVAQTFSRMRDTVVRTFGRPKVAVEDGEFGANLARDLGLGRFVRAYDWDAPGGLLRFGLPRRLDEVVRIEIQHADRFPAVREGLWTFSPVQ